MFRTQTHYAELLRGVCLFSVVFRLTVVIDFSVGICTFGRASTVLLLFCFVILNEPMLVFFTILSLLPICTSMLNVILQ